MTSPFKLGFWNLGFQESMMQGRRRATHLDKLVDVAMLWCRHDLDAVLLCEVGGHNTSLSNQDEVLQRILDFIREEQRKYRGRATEPVLHSHWNNSYLIVWDSQRLQLESVPQAVYFRRLTPDNYRHYVAMVVRKPGATEPPRTFWL